MSDVDSCGDEAQKGGETVKGARGPGVFLLTVPLIGPDKAGCTPSVLDIPSPPLVLNWVAIPEFITQLVVASWSSCRLVLIHLFQSLGALAPSCAIFYLS